MAEEKKSVRDRIWPHLAQVAVPDSRFHFNFEEFICDFAGSAKATERLVECEEYARARTVFITPDNCLEELRLRALRDGKTILTTTYGIRRGFFRIDPSKIEPKHWPIVCLLDGMERHAEAVSLERIRESRMQVDLLVTGTGAINYKGIRFGKGHGFFDLEWAMLYSIGAIADTSIPVAAIVHDCQLLQEDLSPQQFDTVCDIIATPSQSIRVGSASTYKPTCGILWNELQPGMLADIPPLSLLKSMRVQTRA